MSDDRFVCAGKGEAREVDDSWGCWRKFGIKVNREVGSSFAGQPALSWPREIIQSALAVP